MNLSDALAQLERHITTDKGQDALKDALEIARQYDYRVMADTLRNDLLNGLTWEDVEDNVERLAALTAEIRPFPGHENTFKTDVTNVNGLVKVYIRLGDIDTACDLLAIYDKIFTPAGATVCYCVKSRCTCGEKFHNKTDPYCHKCRSPRQLCQLSALANGRCRYHNGLQSNGNIALVKRASERSLVLPGRASNYISQVTSTKLHEAITQAIESRDSLSLAPEIGILSYRAAQLLEQAEAKRIDSGAFSKMINQLQRALEEDEPDEVRNVAEMMVAGDTLAKESDAAWRDFMNTVRTLRDMIQQEQSRIMAATRMVTAEEMVQLRNQTIAAFRAVSETATARLENWARKMDPDIANDKLDEIALILKWSIREVLEKQRKMEQQAAFAEQLRDE